MRCDELEDCDDDLHSALAKNEVGTASLLTRLVPAVCVRRVAFCSKAQFSPLHRHLLRQQTHCALFKLCFFWSTFSLRLLAGGRTTESSLGSTLAGHHRRCRALCLSGVDALPKAHILRYLHQFPDHVDV